jgi:spermidine synthase
MKLAVAALITLLASVVGWLWQDRAYRLSAPGFGVQSVLDHRDSAYSSMTWVVSETDGFMQLRFFDRVEGGICLRPTWSDLIAQATTDPSLRHLVPMTSRPMGHPGPTWSHAWIPDPGTVTNSPYIRLFSAGVLLNERVMAPAGNDPQFAQVRILVVGLGSGVGIAHLAHHFPQASITVVDIDAVVEEMVRDHYPLLAWLETQRLDDGSPRLRFIAADAREFIRITARREAKPYDLVILDAYTSGSTIPPHLMTREFFAECEGILGEGGILAANVIGSLTGKQHRVVGGAIRSLRAAGLVHVRALPVLQPGEGPGVVAPQRTRNHLLFASRQALDPRGNVAGWNRLAAFVPYPSLKAGSSVTAGYLLGRRSSLILNSGVVPAAVVEQAIPGIRSRLTLVSTSQGTVQFPVQHWTNDVTLVREAMEAVQRSGIQVPLGWPDEAADQLHRREIDWVLAARETFRLGVLCGRDVSSDGEALVGPLEGERTGPVNWIIADAPLFTDQMPNADIVNH